LSTANEAKRGLFINTETKQAVDGVTHEPLEWVTEVRTKVQGRWGSPKRLDVWITDIDGVTWHGHGLDPEIDPVTYLTFRPSRRNKE
jgi:hypothetical protein